LKIGLGTNVVLTEIYLNILLDIAFPDLVRYKKNDMNGFRDKIMEKNQIPSRATTRDCPYARDYPILM